MTEKQAQWLEFYLNDPTAADCGKRVFGNATECARRVGYALPNKSGPRLLRSPQIRARIEEFFTEMQALADLERLRKIGAYRGPIHAPRTK